MSTADWLRTHRVLSVYALLVAASGIALGANPEMRANIIGETWGVVGAGLALWVVQELYSAPIQRRAWLRRHRGYVVGVFMNLNMLASGVLSLLLRAPGNREEGIAFTFEMSHRARVALYDDLAKRVELHEFGAAHLRELRPVLAANHQRFQGTLDDAGHVVSQLTDIQEAIATLRFFHGIFVRGSAHPFRDDTDEELQSVAKSLALACIQVGRRTTRMLRESGFLNS